MKIGPVKVFFLENKKCMRRSAVCENVFLSKISDTSVSLIGLCSLILEIIVVAWRSVVRTGHSENPACFFYYHKNN